MEVHKPEELGMLCKALDPKDRDGQGIDSYVFTPGAAQDMMLTQQLSLPGNIKALPNGSRVAGIGPADAKEEDEVPAQDFSEHQMHCQRAFVYECTLQPLLKY